MRPVPHRCCLAAGRGSGRAVGGGGGTVGVVVMTMKLLDLFCKAGGCTRGYQNAGFYVVGVDIESQPRYIGDEFIRGDALECLRGLIDSGEINQFVAISASPPCQGYAKTKFLSGEHPMLIEQLRELLIQSGLSYIIENVKGAPLINPVLLTGGMFGMNILRDRLFECSFPVPQPFTPIQAAPVKMGRPVKEGDVLQPVGHFSGVPYARKQMGIDWMTQGELAQAIPPTYTEYIGKHLLEHLKVTL
jgi:DNA (cytosine-5)-methyltransferase 1